MKVLITEELTPQQLEQIRLIVRDGTVVYTVEKEVALQEAQDTDIAFLGRFAKDILESSPKLRWVHLAWVGVDSLWDSICNNPAVVTCSKGVVNAPMADHVFALLLSLTRNIHTFLRQKSNRDWKREVNNITDLYGKTMGIIGLGNVGREVASRAYAFGMRVLAVKKRPAPISREPVDGLFIGYEGLRLMLPECDVVVITTALTPETHYLIGHNELSSLKKGAFLINVARGSIVDEKALIDALQSGHLTGAGLDVFENEPLPPDSPLWQLPNVIITPHVGGFSDQTPQRMFERFMDNLKYFLADEPLLGVIDKEANY